MESQKTTPQAVSPKVKLDELRLGMMADGTIKVGILGKDGNLDDSKSRDISEDFYNVMRTIGAMQAVALKRKLEAEQKAPVIVPAYIEGEMNED